MGTEITGAAAERSFALTINGRLVTESSGFVVL